MTDDQAILAKFAVQGDAAALGELSRRYEPLVRAVAMREGADADLADDITQSAMRVLVEKGKTLPPELPVGAWLARVAKFLTIDALRGKSARLRHERLAARQRREAANDRQLQLAVHETLQLLPEHDRVPLIMRYLDGRSFDEISDTLNITPPAARQRVSRALAKLRDLLDRRGIRHQDLLASLLIGMGRSKNAGPLAAPSRVKRRWALPFAIALLVAGYIGWKFHRVMAAEPPATVIHQSASGSTGNAAAGRADSTVP